MAAGKNEAPATEAKGANKKLILLIIGVALIAVILSVGVTWFLLSDSGKTDEAATEAAAVTSNVPAKALYFEMPPAFVVTYTVNNKQRYMQVFVTILARDPKAVDVLKLHAPLVRHQLNLLFGEQSFEALQTDEGKQALRQESVRVVNEILQKESPGVVIEQVLFTNFVMQ